MNQNDNSGYSEPKLQCPYCKSTDVEWVDSASIGFEIFITLKCNGCGKEEILDEYQVNDWYTI